MTRSDIYFFMTITAMLLLMIASVVLDFELGDWVIYWWVVLLPFVILKNFFPNSKLTKWFLTKI